MNQAKRNAQAALEAASNPVGSSSIAAVPSAGGHALMTAGLPLGAASGQLPPPSGQLLELYGTVGAGGPPTMQGIGGGQGGAAQGIAAAAQAAAAAAHFQARVSLLSCPEA